ncbi:SAM-dependent methyltransferase [Pseudonocardia sp. CA-107938]|uniref:SAM-dependent methyltransferase n=1 Tax=Pseudonocardia sp. CA-107938 TaxID=3240021 RepID=UPI003D90F75B
MTTSSPGGPEPDLMTDRAHSARAYDYLLGGKDNYAADRAIADAAERAWPAVRLAVRANRAFMTRVARHFAELGVRQFLDVGTGIPTEPNLHQVVQEVAPDARVLYVDNDPIVLAHAAALMNGDPRGRTTYLQADARDPQAILDSPELTGMFDLTQPVALSVIGLLHFLDDETATRLVHTVLDSVPSGSCLALSQITLDLDAETVRGAAAGYAGGGVQTHLRSKEQLHELFLDGLDVLEPGVVVVHRWRPDEGSVMSEVPDAKISVYGVAARKP